LIFPLTKELVSVPRLDNFVARLKCNLLRQFEHESKWLDRLSLAEQQGNAASQPALHNKNIVAIYIAFERNFNEWCLSP
jgi:hypothetical protein